MFQKGRHQTQGGNSVNSQPIFTFFSLSDSPVNLQQNTYQISPTPHMRRYTTLWNITVRKWGQLRNNVVINDKLQGTVLPSVLWRCWSGGMKGIRPVKSEWWGAGMVVGLERGADLHMAQMMSLPLSLASVKSRLVLPFWYRLTRIVPEKRPLNGCVCTRYSSYIFKV